MKRKPRFLNRLEKHRLRRLGILKEKREIRPPSHITFPQGDTIDIRIPPAQEFKAELNRALQERGINLSKPNKEDFKK